METVIDRTQFLGGSDAAGVLGLSRWATPLSVWAEKTGAVVREEREALHLTLGNRLEEVVSELFTQETGKKLARVNEVLTHPQYPFLCANIDRRVVGEDAIFEAKTCSAWKSKEWEGEEIPREYVVQCLHYLAVTGKKRCYLACLIGNQDFQIKTIERDERLLADVVAREVAFWKGYVVTNIMPAVITKYDADTLSRLYPQANEGKIIDLSDEASQIMEALESFKADAKNLEGLIDQHENQLKKLMGDADTGITPMFKVRWINSKRSGLDGDSLKADHPEIHAQYYKSKPTRRFSYKKIKED